MAKTSLGVGKYKIRVGDGEIEFYDLRAVGILTEPPYEQSIFWLASLGLSLEDLAQDFYSLARLTSEPIADMGIRSRLNTATEYACMYGRHIDHNNFYAVYLYYGYSTSDHRIIKKVAGEITVLAQEAVDLPSGYWYWTRLEIVGSTLKSYRATSPDVEEPTEPQLTVTDTDITKGRWGVRHWGLGGRGLHGLFYFLKQPASTPPKPIRYYLVNIKEDEKGVFQPDIPSKPTFIKKLTVFDEEKYNKLRKALAGKFSIEQVNMLAETLGFISTGEWVDKLASTWTVLCPTVKGKPKDSIGVLRIFNVSDVRLFDELEAKGAKKIDREKAVKQALKLDDKVHLADLEPLDEKYADEYIKWKQDTSKIEMTKESAKAYVKSYMGW